MKPRRTLRARLAMAILARSRSPRAVAYASAISPSAVMYVAGLDMVNAIREARRTCDDWAIG